MEFATPCTRRIGCWAENTKPISNARPRAAPWKDSCRHEHDARSSLRRWSAHSLRVSAHAWLDRAAHGPFPLENLPDADAAAGVHRHGDRGARSRRSGEAFAYMRWKPISPIRVRVHGDSAVIRYESDLELHGSRGHYWHTDLYEKREGRSQIVWSQTTGAP